MSSTVTLSLYKDSNISIFENFIDLIDIRTLWYLCGIYIGLYQEIAFGYKIKIHNELKSLFDIKYFSESDNKENSYAIYKSKIIHIIPSYMNDINPHIIYSYDDNDIENTIQDKKNNTVIFTVNNKILITLNMLMIPIKARIIRKILLLIQNKMTIFPFLNLDVYIFSEKSELETPKSFFYTPVLEEYMLKSFKETFYSSLPDFYQHCDQDIINLIKNIIKNISFKYQIPLNIVGNFNITLDSDDIKSILEYFSILKDTKDTKDTKAAQKSSQIKQEIHPEKRLITYLPTILFSDYFNSHRPEAKNDYFNSHLP